jgi:hypothetical protein
MATWVEAADREMGGISGVQIRHSSVIHKLIMFINTNESKHAGILPWRCIEALAGGLPSNEVFLLIWRPFQPQNTWKKV